MLITNMFGIDIFPTHNGYIIMNDKSSPPEALYTTTIAISLYMSGINIADKVVQNFIMKKAFEMTEEYLNKISKISFPKNVEAIFNAKNKKERSKIKISSTDLSDAIISHKKYGYDYYSDHIEFRPEKSKNISFDDKKFFNKVKSLFEQRKLANIHIFVKNNFWYAFCFAQNDILGTHWMGGHIHYASSTTSNNKDWKEILKEFKNRDFHFNEHIKFDMEK